MARFAAYTVAVQAFFEKSVGTRMTFFIKEMKFIHIKGAYQIYLFFMALPSVVRSF